MSRKVFGVLALAGFGWLLWLYLSPPNVTYDGFRSTDEDVTVSCEPLGAPGRNPQDPEHRLSAEQSQAIEKYIKRVQQEQISREEPARLHADLEQVMVAGCEETRLNRLAHLGFVAFVTVVLLLLALRPVQAPPPMRPY